MNKCLLTISFLSAMATLQANASVNVLIVAADGSVPTSQLQNLGIFGKVDSFNSINGTPTLGLLSSYDAVLAYSNNQPQDRNGLGNVLADYVDGGGKVVVATYAFSDPWSIGGKIMTSGYAPLVNNGVNGDVSGSIVPVNVANPTFSGVDLSLLSYFHNLNYAHPGLDTGADLIATDGQGVDLIAENAKGNVIGLNLFPGAGYGNDDFYKLLGNSLNSFGSASPVPEPSTYIAGILMILPFAATGLRSIRNRKK